MGSALGARLLRGGARILHGRCAWHTVALTVVVLPPLRQVNMNPTDHVNWYTRATAAHIDKRYAAALKDLAEVLRLKPDYHQALEKRAKILCTSPSLP